MLKMADNLSDALPIEQVRVRGLLTQKKNLLVPDGRFFQTKALASVIYDFLFIVIIYKHPQLPTCRQLLATYGIRVVFQKILKSFKAFNNHTVPVNVS